MWEALVHQLLMHLRGAAQSGAQAVRVVVYVQDVQIGAWGAQSGAQAVLISEALAVHGGVQAMEVWMHMQYRVGHVPSVTGKAHLVHDVSGMCDRNTPGT